MTGPRLKYRHNLQTDSDPEQYAPILLILFRPFRSRNDLLADSSTWWEAGQSCEPNQFYAKIIAHSQEYHEFRVRAQQSYDVLYMQHLEHETEFNTGDFDNFTNDQFINADFIVDERNPKIFPLSGELSASLAAGILSLQPSGI